MAQQIACTTWHLEYKAGTSNKFYDILATESGVCVLRWGRIGTIGQSNVTIYRTEEEALDHGRKQLYAKKSKGYQQAWEYKFLATADQVNEAKRNNIRPLLRALTEARAAGEYAGAKATVLKHYDDLAQDVHKLLVSAPHQDFEEVNDRYEAIEKIWNEITERHDEVETAMSMAKATLAQKLMAGSS